ncbi:MAG: hypothetical protein LBD13_07990, partial [Spirochaetaceae bacterium]|nr:hypothetical protein [Spirochaetaceae bacterium]
MNQFRLAGLCAAFFLLFACAKEEPPAPPFAAAPKAPPPAAPPAEGSALSPLPSALIKSGASPLWFEFGPLRDGEAGPFLVASPGEAALTPYEPWPLARLV